MASPPVPSDTGRIAIRKVLEEQQAAWNRQDLEGLRQGAGGHGEAALNIVEIQSVGLALFFNFVDQLLPHFGFGETLVGSDDQISLAAGGHQAGLIAAVSVGLVEAFDGHAGHQESLEYPVLNYLDALRGDPFIIVGI